MKPEELDGASLAYLGDAVFEVMVRKRLVEKGTGVAKMNETSHLYVTAASQSKAADRILDLLTEEELVYFKRGRNAKVNPPKSASAYDYRKATGFEALFAFLYLKGRSERLEELFEKGFENN